MAYKGKRNKTLYWRDGHTYRLNILDGNATPVPAWRLGKPQKAEQEITKYTRRWAVLRYIYRRKRKRSDAQNSVKVALRRPADDLDTIQDASN